MGKNPDRNSAMPLDAESAIRRGKECIVTEAEALTATANGINQAFSNVITAINTTLDAGRKLIFSGLGKSAHITQKCVGTFNSIGAPSCFLDPVNALHGDLGLCRGGDLCLLLSNSGESQELVRLVRDTMGVRTPVVPMPGPLVWARMSCCCCASRAARGART